MIAVKKNTTVENSIGAFGFSVLGQDSLLSQCFTPFRCVKTVKWRQQI